MRPDTNGAANQTVRRWQLTETLRELRENSGLTMEQTVEKAKSLGGKWSRSKISRVENREHGIRQPDVDRLLDVYGVTDRKLREWVLGLAEKADERGYWLSLRKDLPEDFHELLGVESALIEARQLETVVVPGLLQTSDYARALISGIYPGIPFEVLDRRVLARIARQRVLNRSSPLRYHVILDETILERQVGTPAVMRGQLGHIFDAAQQEHITIQVLPKSAGATPAIEGPFSVMTLPDPIPDFGYVEGAGGAVYIEDRTRVGVLLERWGILTGRALAPSQSLDLIKQISNTYE